MIIKCINVSNSSVKDLKSILDYVSSPDKTRSDLMGGFCCDASDPFSDMVRTKKLHKKTNGRQYTHYVVSFDPNDNINMNTALQVVGKTAAYHFKHQSFYALHVDTNHLHSHVITNTVGYDGKKFRQWKTQLNQFKEFISNEVCVPFHLEPLRWVKGKKPVDDFNFLEINEDEMLCYKNLKEKCYMANRGYRDYEADLLDDICDDDDIDNDLDDEDDNSLAEIYYDHQRGNKHIYVGTQVNCYANSADDAVKLAKSIHVPELNFNENQLRRVSQTIEPGVSLHIGNTYNLGIMGNSFDDFPEEENTKRISTNPFLTKGK